MAPLCRWITTVADLPITSVACGITDCGRMVILAAARRLAAMRISLRGVDREILQQQLDIAAVTEISRSPMVKG